jgi:hypothetical protein
MGIVQLTWSDMCEISIRQVRKCSESARVDEEEFESYWKESDIVSGTFGHSDPPDVNGCPSAPTL